MNRFVPLVLALLPSVALAADPAPTVTGAWSRATAGTSAPGVAYLTITDPGAADALISVNTPVAAKAALHESKTVNGIMSMSAVPSLPIAQGGSVTFAPGGYHIMLEGLKQPLKAGDHFPLTLVFEHAGAVTTNVEVRPLGADKPASDGMSGMKM
jgi:copper(I)-binding protein